MTRNSRYLGIWLYLFSTIGVESEKVSWDIANPPIMFGKDLQLKCNIKCCLRNVTTSAFWEMEWPNGTVETISVDELSLKPSKYEILVGNDGCILVIRKFEEMDALPKYICRFKFQNFNRSLSLQNEAFEMQPTPSTMKVVAETIGGDYNIYVQFLKVYPKPMCLSMINDRNITSTIKEQVAKEVFFYSANYSLYFPIEDGLFTMICKVGELSYTIKETEFVLIFRQHDDQAVWVQREINIVLASAIITLFTLLILMIWTCWEKDFRYFRGWLLLLYFTWAEQNPLPGGIRGILYNEYPHNTSASTAIKVEADQLSESESQPLIV